MEKETLPIEEVISLLKKNGFEELFEEDEDKLEYYYTPFQTRLKLKIPVDIPEFNMALQSLGIRCYYKGHTIPYDPYNAAFIIKENSDGKKYIQPLMKRSLMNELESFIEDNETFNEYMRSRCKKDANALLKNTDFRTLSLLTSGPSENFSHILTFSCIEIEKLIKTGRSSNVYVNNELTEKEIEEYTTPYKEGVKSAYEKYHIAVPGMKECKDINLFYDLKNSSREYYKICNKKNIIVDDPIKTKNFIAKLLEKTNLSQEYRIDEISKNYISTRRISKYIYNEYLPLKELCEKLKYKKTMKFSSIGEATILADIIPLLRLELIKFEKENCY